MNKVQKLIRENVLNIFTIEIIDLRETYMINVELPPFPMVGVFSLKITNRCNLTFSFLVLNFESSFCSFSFLMPKFFWKDFFMHQ